MVQACKPSTWECRCRGIFQVQGQPKLLEILPEKVSLLSVIIYDSTEILHFSRSIVLETALRLKRILRLSGKGFHLTGSRLRDPVEGTKL